MQRNKIHEEKRKSNREQCSSVVVEFERTSRIHIMGVACVSTYNFFYTYIKGKARTRTSTISKIYADTYESYDRTGKAYKKKLINNEQGEKNTKRIEKYTRDFMSDERIWQRTITLLCYVVAEQRQTIFHYFASALAFVDSNS